MRKLPPDVKKAHKKAQDAAYRSKNRERLRMQSRERSKKHYASNYIRYRRKHLGRRYGITLEFYNEMLTRQNNKCALCQDEFVKPPHVDHCHKTGKIRGLLCNCCNRWVLPKVEKAGTERFKRYLFGEGEQTASGITPQPARENVDSADADKKFILRNHPYASSEYVIPDNRVNV